MLTFKGAVNNANNARHLIKKYRSVARKQKYVYTFQKRFIRTKRRRDLFLFILFPEDVLAWLVHCCILSLNYERRRSRRLMVG